MSRPGATLTTSDYTRPIPPESRFGSRIRLHLRQYGGPATGPANEALAGVPVNDLAAGVSTKKLYRNAHLTSERAPRLSVAPI
jgi:hypothetical protein